MSVASDSESPPPPPTTELTHLDHAATRHETRCGAGRMVWRSWGEGAPLVLLHGDFGSWAHWVRNIPALAQHARVIAADMPGYGESDLPPEPWSPASVAHILAEGLDEILGAGAPFSLAGFSFGGIIAGHLAALAGARVRQLFLFGPGGLGIPPGPLPPLRRVERRADAAAVAAAHRHNLAAVMIADPAKVDDLAVWTQVENVRRARLRAGDIPASSVLAEVLPQVSARVFGIWGERDAFAQPRVAARAEVLRQRCGGEVTFRTIPGAGHWTPYEAAGAVNGILLGAVK